MTIKTSAMVTLLAAGLAWGCAQGAEAAGRPAPKPMPVNAHWAGLYQGPYHITLNIQTQGNNAKGTWRAIGDREGEFSGTVSGNLLVMDWSERGLRNGEVSTGRGYFVYEAGKILGAHEIYGQWGMGQAGTSSPWWAIKRAEQPLDAKTAKLVDKDSLDDDRSTEDVQPCDLNCDTMDNESQ